MIKIILVSFLVIFSSLYSMQPERKLPMPSQATNLLPSSMIPEEDEPYYSEKRMKLLQQKIPGLQYGSLPESKGKTRDGVEYSGPNIKDPVLSSIYVDQKSEIIAIANEAENVMATYQAEEPFNERIKIYSPKLIQGRSILACSEKKMAMAFGSYISVWDLDSERFICELQGHTKYVQSVAYNPKNSNILISGSDDTTVRVWDLRSRNCSQCIKILLDKPSNSAAIHSVAIHPINDQCFASVNASNTLRFWDLRNCRSPGFALGSFCLKFNRTGSLLATGGPGIARLYELSSLNFNQKSEMLLPGQWGQQKAEPISFDFAPDDSNILMSGQFQDIFVFDTAMSQIKGRIHSGLLDVSAHYSADGSKILSSGLFHTDGGSTVRIWDLKKIAAVTQTKQQRTATTK